MINEKGNIFIEWTFRILTHYRWQALLLVESGSTNWADRVETIRKVRK